MRNFGLFGAAVVSLALLASPALAKSKKYYEQEESKYYDLKESEKLSGQDPWEGFNRSIFDFNLWVDRNMFKPFLVAYDVIPKQGRNSIGNFLTNLGEPLNTIHGVLQLNPKVTFTSMFRFVLNTTFGMGGIHDFARDYASLPNMEQNLGKTFGAWGVPSGPYLVLPIIGPNNLRGAVGMAGNWALDPIVYTIKPWEAFGQRVAEGIDYRDSQATVIENLYYESIDPYVATRSAFLQNEAFTAGKQQ